MDVVTSMSPRRGLFRARGLALAFLMLAAFAVTPGLGIATQACAQESEVVVVVESAEVPTQSFCQDLPEGSTGLEVLKATGLEVITKTTEFGEQICKVGDVGTDDCSFDVGFYWAYYHGDDGSWTASEVGADSYEVPPGAIEGWVWQDADADFATARPETEPSFDAICAAAAAESEMTDTDAAEGDTTDPASDSGLLPLWIALGIAVVVGGAYLVFRSKPESPS